MFRPPTFGGPCERTVLSLPASCRCPWRITSGNISFTEIRMEDNSTIKEKSLQPSETAVRSAVRERASTTTIETLDQRILAALHAASEKKALDLVLLDLR